MPNAKYGNLSFVFTHILDVADVPDVALDHLPTLPDLPQEGEIASVTLPTQGADHLPDLTHVSDHANLPDFLL